MVTAEEVFELSNIALTHTYGGDCLYKLSRVT